MLTPDPAVRATLAEVLSHPWMVLGSNGPPDSHMPQREPLRADQLDHQVIRGMTGFEFGSEEDIEKKLLAILECEEYVRAVQHWEKERNVGGHLNAHDSRWVDLFSLPAWGELSNPSHFPSFDGSLDDNVSSRADPPTSPRNTRRFSLRLFSRSTQPVRPTTQDSSDPENHAPRPSSSEKIHSTVGEPNGEPQPLDPTGGYHPLLSIYYLVREKLERERLNGSGLFASSQLLMQDPSRKKEPPSPVLSGSKADGNVVQAPPPSPGTLDYLYENGNANSTRSDLSSQEANKKADRRASDLSWQEANKKGDRRASDLSWQGTNKKADRRASGWSWEREQAKANIEKELQRNEEEARRKEEEVKEKEELRKKDEEVRKRELEVREHEEQVRTREEKVKEREEGVDRREEEVRTREEEVRKCEEEVSKRTEEAQQRELEARRNKETLDVDIVCARLFMRLQAPESFKKLVGLEKEPAQEMMDLLQKVRLALVVSRHVHSTLI